MNSNIYKGLGSTRLYTLQKIHRVLGMAVWLNANWEPLVSTSCWRAYVITTWQLTEVWNRIIIHSCPPFWNNDNENNLFLSPPRNRKTWRGTRILKQKIPREKSGFSNSKAVHKFKRFPCKCIFSLVIIRPPVREAVVRAALINNNCSTVQKAPEEPRLSSELSRGALRTHLQWASFPRLTKPRSLLQALPCFPKNLQTDTADSWNRVGKTCKTASL